jgi:hypothetical protein
VAAFYERRGATGTARHLHQRAAAARRLLARP